MGRAMVPLLVPRPPKRQPTPNHPMAAKKTPPSGTTSAYPLSISELLGASPVLPGESAELYRRGVIATVQELGAQTPLQVYLAEKIFECLWWMRRYEHQKHVSLASEMATLLEPGDGPAVKEMRAMAMELIMANEGEDGLLAAMARHNLSPDSLRQRALYNLRKQLQALDEQLALKAKTLAGLQASFEVLANRRTNAERLRLQNDLLRRDLGALEAPQPHEVKPKKAPR